MKRKVSDAEEVANYYNRMAEDYREKYLSLQREFNYLKDTHMLDIENQTEEHKKAAQTLQNRHEFDKIEAETKKA